MATRVLRSEEDRAAALTWLRSIQLPCTLSVAKGANRTVEQNRLQRLWINEAADQLGGNQTAEELRGWLKLHIGVPMLREESEDFREQYDRIIKPLPYEDKLAIMMEPLDFPVTRLMATSTKTRYLDEMHRYLSVELGCALTEPNKWKRK